MPWRGAVLGWRVFKKDFYNGGVKGQAALLPDKVKGFIPAPCRAVGPV